MSTAEGHRIVYRNLTFPSPKESSPRFVFSFFQGELVHHMSCFQGGNMFVKNNIVKSTDS